MTLSSVHCRPLLPLDTDIGLSDISRESVGEVSLEHLATTVAFKTTPLAQVMNQCVSTSVAVLYAVHTKATTASPLFSGSTHLDILQLHLLIEAVHRREREGRGTPEDFSSSEETIGSESHAAGMGAIHGYAPEALYLLDSRVCLQPIEALWLPTDEFVSNFSCSKWAPFHDPNPSKHASIL